MQEVGVDYDVMMPDYLVRYGAHMPDELQLPLEWRIPRGDEDEPGGGPAGGGAVGSSGGDEDAAGGGVPPPAGGGAAGSSGGPDGAETPGSGHGAPNSQASARPFAIELN